MRHLLFTVYQSIASCYWLAFRLRPGRLRRRLPVVLLAGGLLGSLPARAQQEYSRWYFGAQAGLWFPGGGAPVQALADGRMLSGEGCASVSDAQGNLLFYTNGAQVWNRQHQVMTNGTGLGGYEGPSEWPVNSATQGVAAVARPGSSTEYYIFTLDAAENQLRNGLAYSVVDMSRQGGLGAVTTKAVRVPLGPPPGQLTERLALVRHANQRDLWLVVHGWLSNVFYSLLLTPAGLASAPVVSAAGLVHAGGDGPRNNYNAIGQLKASPNGRLLALTQFSNASVELLDFNDGTGAVSNGRFLAAPRLSNYGVEFSPNSQLVYVSGGSSLLQFDLTRGGPAYEVASDFGALQLGPDQQLYHVRRGTRNFDIIQAPDQPGAACAPVLGKTLLPLDTYSQLGLPLVPAQPPPPPAPLVSFAVAGAAACQGGPVTFTAAIYPAAPTAVISWEFGEPAAGAANVATGPTVQHSYLRAGTYTATMRVQLPGGSLVAYAQAVTVRLAASGHRLIATPQCSTRSARLEVDPAPPANSLYYWQDGSTTSSLVAKTPGLYWVDVVPPGQCAYRDSLQVGAEYAPTLSLGPDRVLACGQHLTLDASSNVPGSTYRWQDGSTGPQLTTRLPGTFSVTLTTPAGCSATATVQLRPSPECGPVVPNVLTPNDDGLNDALIITNVAAGSCALAVYDRWGRLVYQQAHYANDWQAAGLAAGLYYYLLTLPTGERHKGWVEVLR